MYNKLKIFSENEIENLERIKKDENEIKKQTILRQKIEKHKKFFIVKIIEYILLKNIKLNNLKKSKGNI